MVDKFDKAIERFKEEGGAPYAIIIPMSLVGGVLKKEFNVDNYNGLIVYKCRILSSEFNVVSELDYLKIKDFEDKMVMIMPDWVPSVSNIGNIR